MACSLPSIPESHYHNLEQIERQYWWHLSRLNWAEWLLRSKVPNPSERHALDYGCGTGGFLHLLNERVRFKSRLGVDISEKAIEAAKKFGDHYQQIAQDDFTVAKGRDLIFLMDTLEHIEDDTRFLKRLFESLKPGAFVLISVPAMPSMFTEWDRVLGHYRRYEKSQLAQIVSQAGGRVKWIHNIFSYVVPAMLITRIWRPEQVDASHCEFPPVSPKINKILLALNRLEIRTANMMEFPFGSSLMCLVEF